MAEQIATRYSINLPGRGPYLMKTYLLKVKYNSFNTWFSIKSYRCSKSSIKSTGKAIETFYSLGYRNHNSDWMEL